jgi:hypothetical protein
MSMRLFKCVVAILFLYAVVAYMGIWRSTKRTRKVLPKNPCSVASVASLLVGSDLPNITPPSTEYLSNRQMREQGAFRGRLFSLRLWDERRWFDVDIGKADE